MSRHKLSDKSWERIKDLLPPERSGKKGRPAKDNRQIVNAILWILRTGSPWRDLPEEYGSCNSVYSRFRLKLFLTGGEIHDIVPASDLLSGFSDCNVLADKGYDSGALVADLQNRNNTAIIPSRSNRKNPSDYDHHLLQRAPSCGVLF